DLRMKLFIDPAELKQYYAASPDWLKKLMIAWADGINYFLYKNPQVKPKLLSHFEPWMALSFTEGSIGGDIERVSISKLREFYGGGKTDVAYNDQALISDDEPRGSNGFAIAPKLTANGNALFLINPHTSFFFRSEVHMVSEEGLNAYGAVTWGQCFIYQGFKSKTGWMHTSSAADVIDEYLETIVEKDGKYFYTHGENEKELKATTLHMPYKTDNGMAYKDITVYHSHHGPIIREDDGKWVAIALMNTPVDALTQSYSRTKTTGNESFRKMMQTRTNSSNNTVYADADGNIAYYHGNYMPRRDPSFDWSKPVDGSNPATDYKGLHNLDEMIIILNPENGWIQNCNSTPFTAAGPYSPKPENYPIYMAPDNENFRGLHAVEVLENKSGFTLESLIAAAYDSHLNGFETLLPPLLSAYDKAGSKNRKVRDAISLLKKWDKHFSEESVETSLAIYWATEAQRLAYQNPDRGEKSANDFITDGMSNADLLAALTTTIKRLEDDFGSYKTAWGVINRLQRINGDIQQPFDDSKASLPVGFASSRWGSLASFGARTYPGTKRMYGTSGNSFVAVVEFGDRIQAKSIVNGGQSSDPNSPHFHDQGLMYTKGEFKDVYYYREDIEKNAEKTYQPGLN
ncbi:MAG: penicillin acylase family protein, partial [Calditrichaeota bacterium]|nr:penicillin acylase family protein [Calditrichota bacterium]